ncbi:serine/threonine-protein kinase [Acanthopleuribacter pedis]|uniref:Serine/threonine protein kinase n=1 Tax=Acanthopleuribacter pedis TaxID=442870 RepID=A0A8J7U3B7_9BACT|nr:serine/threonine-protein kinase [Acanthopleuribacter pedis]MBO1317106.1 serine/threonine protein kinase [Acanthopleuribacter pedis]
MSIEDFRNTKTHRSGGPPPRPQSEAGEFDSVVLGIPYQIEAKIGRGGMGTVYRARQEVPNRLVALKLISGGRLDQEFQLRFKSEYEVLALMNHPNVAAVYDVGLTNSGESYFTMEYVPDSCNILEYCQGGNLSISERMNLFLQVCRGVMHAHQHAVIHRDLKPANILVHGGDPLVKIIDFGIAKQLESNELMHYQTRQGDLVGTPAYMSPEQLAGGKVLVDTRSDIYALGLILYQLATDLPPFDRKSMANMTYDACLRHFREVGPEPARERNATVSADLDAVIGKALAKDVEKRYATVEAFAADVQNILENRPVSARPRGFFYLAGKFLRRNRFRFVFSAACGAMLLAAFGLQWLHRQHQFARESAESLNDLMEAVQWTPNPNFISQGKELAALRQLEKDLNWPGREDRLKAKTHNTLGEVYFQLDQADFAIVHFKKALESDVGALDEHKTPVRIDYHLNLSRAYRAKGEVERAIAQARAAKKLIDNPAVTVQEAVVNVHLAAALSQSEEGAFEAENLLIRAIDVLRAVEGETHDDFLLGVGCLADLYQRQRKYSRAEVYYRIVLEKRPLVEGLSSPPLLSAQNNLAFCLRRQGRFDEAEALLRQSLAIRKDAFPERHPSVVRGMDSLGRLLLVTGEFEEAAALYRQIVAHLRAKGDCSGGLKMVNHLARALWAMQDYEGALAVLKDMLARCEGAANPDQRSLRTANILGQYQLECGMPRQALVTAFPFIAADDVQAPKKRLHVSRYIEARAFYEIGASDIALDLFYRLAAELTGDPMAEDELALRVHAYISLAQFAEGDRSGLPILQAYLAKIDAAENPKLVREIVQLLDNPPEPKF